MLDQLGLSFLPSADNGPRGGESGPGGGRLEDVLRILSFRLPKVLGAKAIAPADLLNSPGGDASPTGGGYGGDPIADLITRTVLQNIPQAGVGGGGANPAGSFAPPVMPGGGGGQSMPPPPTQNYKPRIIPIEDPQAMTGRGRPFNREMDDLEGQLIPGKGRGRQV